MSAIDFDLEFVDLEDLEVENQRKRRERWLATYTTAALRQAALVDTKIVKHHRFEELIGSLDRMFLLSKELQQPVGGVISGSSGVGKSTLCKYFLDTLPQHDLAGGASGVLYLELRRDPALASVIRQIFELLKYPLFKTPRDSVDAKRSLSIEALRRQKIRLLIVDKAHRILSARTTLRDYDSKISDYFQEIMDKAQIAICLVGDSPLSNLKKTDPSLGERCMVNETMRDFQLNQNWLSLAQTILPNNNVLNLKDLQSSHEGRKALFDTAHGNPRRLKMFLIELTMEVVDKGASTPDNAALQLAFQRTFGSEELLKCPWK